MPFADFLTQVGGGSAIGRVGRAFGGTTEQERVRQEFVEKKLKPFVAGIKAADTDQKVMDFANQNLKGLLADGVMLGIKPEKLEQLTDSFIGPALQNLRRGEIGRIEGELGPQTTPLTPRVAPEGQGQPFDLGTSFTPQTTPGRDYSQADTLAIAKYGKIPEGFSAALEVPSKVTENLAQARGHAVTGAQKEYELGQQRRLENIQLPGSAGEAGMTAGMLATPHAAPLGSYMTGLNPQREPSGAALDLKRQGLDIQQQRLQVLADRVASGQATAGERQALAQQKLELDRAKFELQKQGSETEREGQLTGTDTEIFLKAIVDEAVRTGKTTPEDLRAIAAKRNLILEGEPSIETTGIPGPEMLGLGRERTLTGQGVRLRRAPTVATKRPGQAPTGQPPAGTAPAGGRPPPPKAGTVIQGFRFKGGDPANQANWEQVR